MRHLVLIVLLAWSASCATPGVTPPGAVEIATYDTRSGNVSSFNRALFRSEFPDGMPIASARVEKVQGRYYLVLAGTRSPGSVAGDASAAGCRTMRFGLADDRRGHLSLRTIVETESCNGVRCESCEFATPPVRGCHCDRATLGSGPLGHCIHNITRTTTTAYLRRLDG